MPYPCQRLAPLALALALATGCAATAPDVPGGGGGPALVPAQARGSLAIRFPGLERYRVQYSAAEIAKLSLAVRAADGTTLFSADLTSEDVRGRGGNLMVADLPAGVAVTVQVQVFNGEGTKLGTATSAPVTIVAGAVVSAALTLQLADTPAGTTPTGGLALDVTVLDGATLPAAPPSPSLGTYGDGTLPTPTPTPTPSTVVFDVSGFTYMPSYTVHPFQSFTFRNIGDVRMAVSFVTADGTAVGDVHVLGYHESWTGSFAEPASYRVSLGTEGTYSCGIFGGSTCYTFYTFAQPFFTVVD